VNYNNQIYIGTSGWSYKHWKGIFYPENVKQKDWFKYFTTRYSTVEINNTFYNLPEKYIFEKWRNAVPGNFIYAVKANRIITHIKKLKDVETELNNFLENVRELKEKLGIILFQFPPQFKVDKNRLEYFLHQIPHNLNYVFEFRNPSWWSDEIFELLHKFQISFCNFEMPQLATPRISTSEIVYIRFHNPFDKNLSHFENYILEDWANYILKSKYEGKKVFAYFNNDLFGHAITDADNLIKIIKERI